MNYDKSIAEEVSSRFHAKFVHQDASSETSAIVSHYVEYILTEYFTLVESDGH